MQIADFLNGTNFKGATININALSDTHGHLESVDSAYQTMTKNDTFIKENKGCKNYLIIGGDWFISGGKKGYRTNPDKPLAKFQTEMFNKFINQIKKNFPDLTTLFVPGNHEFDGGAKIFKDAVDELDADVLISNLDFNNKGILKKEIQEGKVIDSKIDSIKDDKDPNLRHYVLNLGVSPVNLEYYNETDGEINLVENSKVCQKDFDPKNYQKTKEVILNKVKDFKQKYPDGTVILECHTGLGFADDCAKEGVFDLIFDGHEHKDEIRTVNDTPIVALSKDFKKIVNAKIIKDDSGKTKSLQIKSYNPLKEDFKTGEIGKFYQKLFQKDFKNIYTIKSNSGLKELNTDSVRHKNSGLANFITDAVLSEIKKRDDTIQIFALNASSIRGGFKISNKPSISPFDVSKSLDGIVPEVADLYVTDVSGEELSYMVLDNFLFNSKDIERNPLIQYSGLIIDKTSMMRDYQNGNSLKDLCKYITLKETGKPVTPDETYRIANPEKYFIKAHNDELKNMINKSKPLGLNVHDLLKEYFENNKEIEFEPDTRLY